MIQLQRPSSEAARRLVLSAFVSLVVAGCTTGDSPPTALPMASPAWNGATAPATTAPATPVAPATPAAPTAAPVVPTGAGAVLPALPPAAFLAGADGVPVPGELGSYTWNGSGSDAPWILPPRGAAVAADGPFAVSFGADVVPESWTLRWAPVVDGTAGDVVEWSEGTALPVAIGEPERPGSWALQADVRFSGGHRAAWYWRVEAGP